MAIPHLLLVGAPVAFPFSWGVGLEDNPRLEWTGAGVLGAVAAVCALIAGRRGSGGASDDDGCRASPRTGGGQA